MALENDDPSPDEIEDECRDPTLTDLVDLCAHLNEQKARMAALADSQSLLKDSHITAASARTACTKADVWQIADMSATLTHRFTVEEYYRMAETGILKPDARVELIEGEIVDMMPIGPFHSSVGSLLNVFLSQSANGRWIVWNQYPLHIDEHNHPQPDLMLVRPPVAKYRESHPTPEDIFLLVEVSDSSLVYDQRTKLPIYGRAGIEEVWILNVPQRQMEVYREPNYLGYESKVVVRAGSVAPKAFPDAVIDLKELWG